MQITKQEAMKKIAWYIGTVLESKGFTDENIEEIIKYGGNYPGSHCGKHYHFIEYGGYILLIHYLPDLRKFAVMTGPDSVMKLLMVKAVPLISHSGPTSDMVDEAILSLDTMEVLVPEPVEPKQPSLLESITGFFRKFKY